MKIYFSCSITGGRNDQVIYAAIVAWMLGQGQEVLTAHLVKTEALTMEADLLPQTVFKRDIAWVDAAEVMVAEVSTPSHGVGYEVAYAVMTGKPVLCLAREGVKVSKMISGNDRLTFVRYREEGEAMRAVEGFLKRGW